MDRGREGVVHFEWLGTVIEEAKRGKEEAVSSLYPSERKSWKGGDGG